MSQKNVTMEERLASCETELLKLKQSVNEKELERCKAEISKLQQLIEELKNKKKSEYQLMQERDYPVTLQKLRNAFDPYYLDDDLI